MYGPGDPTNITGLPLSKEDVVLKAKKICQTAMPLNWEWGFVPLSSTNPPTEEVRNCATRVAIPAKQRFPRIESDKRGPVRKRPLDKVDPDPYIHWTELKMGHASSTGPQPQVHEHVAPLQAEVGQEFLDKLASEGRKNKALSRAYALQGRYRHEAGELRGNGQDLVSSSFKPGTSRYRQSFFLPSGSNIGADTEAAGRAEPQVPPVQKSKKKKKTSRSSPSKPVPDSSVPASSTPPPEAPVPEPTGATPTPPPEAPTAKHTGSAPTPPQSQGPSAAKPTPPPEGAKFRVSEPFKRKATASGTSAAGPQSLVLHVAPAATVAGEKATGLLGQITELKREGKELGHLLDYTEKWN
nr:formin-like protein 16 [Lolium perenne]